MSETTPDRAWAGRVLFPRSAAELRSTTSCPACLAPLTSTVCTRCGLDLRHPASVELARSSAEIADALDARLDIIGRIRRETSAAAVASVAATAAPHAESAPSGAAASPTVPAPVAAPLPVGAPVVADGPRRSGIQIALIVVGISLLSVFAVFGLVYAFVTYGSEVRMAIIVVGTLATMIAAGMLARRGLGSTAEGVAALGTVMLVLDAWALRLNDPSGLGANPEYLYWGVALLVVGATAALWSRISRLGTPAVAAAALLPIGGALATAQLVDELLPAIGGAVTTAAALAGVATAAVAWLAVPAARPLSRRAAQVVALAVGAIASSAGLISIIDLDPPARYSPVIAGLLLAGAALLHVATLAPSLRRARSRQPLDTLALVTIGSGAAFAAVVGAVVSALRFDQDRVVVSAPLIAATAVAVLVEQGWRRAPADSPWRTTFSAAAIVAGVLASLAAGLAAIVAIAAFVEAGTQGLEIIPLGIGDPVTSADRATVAAIGALGLALGLIALSWATLGLLLHRARALTLIAALVIVAAVPLLPAWWLVMTAFAVLAVGGAVGLHAARQVSSTDARRALVALCIPLSTGAALGAFLTGWGVSRGWVVGLIIALVTIGIARPTTAVVPLRAGFLAVAAALVLGSMPELASDLAAALPSLQISASSIVIAAAAIVISACQLGRLPAAERWAVGAVAVVAALAASVASPSPFTDDAIAVALFAAALALAAVRGGTPERLVARAVLPLAVARGAGLAATSALQPGTAPDPSLVTVVALAALVVVAVMGLLVSRAVRPNDAQLDARSRSVRTLLLGTDHGRLVGDTTAALTGFVIVLSVAEGGGDSLLWMAVLVLAVLALVIAISRDGLVGSSSPRRFVGWVALAIATSSLWMRLADAGERAPEPYMLPLTGAMLLVVAATALVGRGRAAGPSRSAAPLTAAALLVALLPSAVQSVEGTDARAIVVALVAVALVIAPLLAERRIDADLPGMSTALVSAGLAALSVLALAHTIDLLIDAAGTQLEGGALLRAALVVIVLSALAVAVRVLAEGRLRDAATAAAIGVAALCAGVLGLTGAINPIELVSLPLALALLAIGTVHLDAEPAARSWPWLGPGFVVLMAPSLMAIDGAGEPLWRAVALGATAASVFIGGLWRRLQAPFVLGGSALLIHLVVQSWPLLDLVGRSVEWWLWLGLGGVLIIVLAARYERRLQNVREAASRIAELR